jgi:hypothetical protein
LRSLTEQALAGSEGNRRQSASLALKVFSGVTERLREWLFDPAVGQFAAAVVLVLRVKKNLQ